MTAPLAERALQALHICPDCGATGREPHDGDWSNPDAEMVDCHRCDGTGDLLGALLTRAYRVGRDDALEEMRSAIVQVGEMINLAQPRTLTADELQRRVAA